MKYVGLTEDLISIVDGIVESRVNPVGQKLYLSRAHFVRVAVEQLIIMERKQVT